MPRPPWIKKTNDRPKWVKGKQTHEVTKYSATGKQSLYQSKRWRRVRKGYMMKHPLCEKCKHIGITVEAKVLDHVIPVKQNGAIWNEQNFMSLCDVCHNIKRQREQKGRVIESKEDHNGELIPVDRTKAYEAY